MWRPFAVLLVLFFATTRAARASEVYPDVIRASVSTSQPLPCTLCHAVTDGATVTIDTLWGQNMLDFGMNGSDPVSLQRALRRNAARGWDSDGDGVPDIEELVFGTDPSTRALDSGPPLEHGCTVGRRASKWELTIVLFALIAWRIRRRR
jgi:hypothetical protein